MLACRIQNVMDIIYEKYKYVFIYPEKQTLPGTESCDEFAQPTRH